MESGAVIELWSEYIREIFSDDRAEMVDLVYNEEGPTILKEEIVAAMKRMKAGKAVGVDGIAIEMLEALGDFAVDKITTLANSIYETGVIEEQMYKSIFIPIAKIQGTLECNKHRMISIMSHVTEIILRVVIARVRYKLSPEISNEQYGFVKGKSTANAVFVLRTLAERMLEVGKDLYCCFIKYDKAFDKVRHEDLMEMLEELQIDGRDLRIIKNLYWRQKAAVRVGEEESEWQSIERGVRQGCVMSPDLFNLYSEIIFRIIDGMDGVKVGGRNVNNIRYADDTVLVADSQERLQGLVEKVVEESIEKGLRVNKGKTEVMVISRRAQIPICITIEGDEVTQVNKFDYLECLVTKNGTCEEEIKRRIAIAKSAFSKIKKMVTNSKISISIRKRYVKCYVWSTLLYGCESWTVSVEMEKKIKAVEMWIWRRVLKVSWTQWKTNDKILKMMDTSRELVRQMKQRQLRFFGHIMREQQLESRGHEAEYYRQHPNELSAISAADRDLDVEHKVSEDRRLDVEQKVNENHDHDVENEVNEDRDLDLQRKVIAETARNDLHVDDVIATTYGEVVSDASRERFAQLTTAIERGDLRGVQQLLDRKHLLAMHDETGATPLHVAVLRGETAIVRYIVSYSSLDSRDQKGRTPLHYAATLRDGGHIYKILVKAGASPVTNDQDGLTPNDYLEEKGSKQEIERKMKDEGSGHTEGRHLAEEDAPRRNTAVRI
ncbi:PREDICTED: uncharacterized protein LOC106816918 [Priapulus caudatus]|uniref:Uncharacterized protein LOC106816918 n=1 Tax=Priapulus caudatus TaxID=37621 RepID=A0ABM1EXX6_PRICU|nr:PREDICTED: uncharacterized protein LOC106816918 [Priapulus caudatus]